MAEGTKLAWHSDLKCPKCGNWMRNRGCALTTEFYYAHVVCGRCGIHEEIKIPIEQYVVRSEGELVREEIEEPKKRESVGKKLYGRKGQARSARRVSEEKK